MGLRTMTTQNKLIFFAIIGLAILVIGGLFILEQTDSYTLPSRQTLQATITVAAAPGLEKWLQDAAKTFNEQDSKLQVKISSFKSNEAERKLVPSNPALPDVWLPEGDFVRQKVGQIPYQTSGSSLAQDSLIWVAVQKDSMKENDLAWQPIHDIAVNNMQFKLALPPKQSATSMAACVSAAAAYHKTAALTANMGSDRQLQTWFREILDAVPSRDRSPQEQLTRRPPQVTAGLLLRSEAYTLTQTNFITQLPEYNINLNYPYLMRAEWPELSSQEAAAHQEVAEKFRAFLLSANQQSQLTQYGLGQASDAPAGQFVQPDEGIIRSLQWCWN